MGCVPTALCAISGRTPEEIGLILSRAAALNDYHIGPQLLWDYNIAHWLDSIRLMGGGVKEAVDFRQRPLESRPTIEEWLTQPDDRLSLVYCDAGGNVLTHVFARQDNALVDTYTNGVRIPVGGMPRAGPGNLHRTISGISA